MSLADIVSVSIVATSPGITQAGFGTPLILAVNASWTERVRFYTDISGVGDDFAETTPEYLAASAIFAQNPRPERLAIGRCANKPTQKRTITPTVANSTAYTIRVGEVSFTYTSDGSATAAEIVAGLIALINAGTDNLTATGSTTLILTANSAGLWDDVEVADPTLLSLVEDHADPGVTADLNAILNEDTTWYAVVSLFNSQLVVEAIAAWVETNKKFFAYATQDVPCEQVAEVSATDVAKSLKDDALGRSAGIYHRSNGEFADAAWVGRVLPYDPGSETWAHKTLAGVSPVRLTATQRTNLLAKNLTVYETNAGRNGTFEGKVAGGEWIDVVRFIDWLTARIQERVYALISDAANPKIPYTDRGINQIAGVVRATLAEGVDVGGLESYQVQVPKAKDADPDDKAARILRGLTFTGVLAGAIHRAVIRGTVTV